MMAVVAAAQAVEDAIRKQGLESCNLIVGVDFTRSNTWNGQPKKLQTSTTHSGAWVLNSSTPDIRQANIPWPVSA
jgi:hypothetical protein